MKKSTQIEKTLILTAIICALHYIASFSVFTMDNAFIQLKRIQTLESLCLHFLEDETQVHSNIVLDILERRRKNGKRLTDLYRKKKKYAEVNRLQLRMTS